MRWGWTISRTGDHANTVKRPSCEATSAMLAQNAAPMIASTAAASGGPTVPSAGFASKKACRRWATTRAGE